MIRRVIIAFLLVAFIGCGEEEADEPTTAEPPSAEQRDESAPQEEQSNDPLARAEAYAQEQYPEATATDDFLAAAVTGCYLGITGEYLGGPADWSLERTMNLEYPEPELQAVLKQARADCR